MYVATLRYRRLWWAILGAGALAAFLFIGLGIGEQFAERVVEGVQFRDQANQMRLAEYQNAIEIIRNYPVFGIGFGQAPQLDLVAGVSSIYLALADYSKAIELDPKLKEPWHNRGLHFAKLGQADKAVADFTKAI